MFQAYFEVFPSLFMKELMTFEDPSLTTHGYQLLPLAITQLVGSNREFDVSGIFGGVLLIVGGEELITVMPTGMAGGHFLLNECNLNHLNWGKWLHRIKQRTFPSLLRDLAVVHRLFNSKSRSNNFK